MSAEDLDNYETDAELALYREYRDVIKLFTYVVETERRFYLANKVDFNVRSAGQDVYFDVQLTDASDTACIDNARHSVILRRGVAHCSYNA